MAFVVRAARAEADRVLSRADVTVMPAEQLDALIGSLGVADPARRSLGPLLDRADSERDDPVQPRMTQYSPG